MASAAREKKKQAVIKALNAARSMELQAIHQYMNHHYSLDDKDYGEMAAAIKLIAIDEMRHAEMFAERIEELGGEPTSVAAGRIKHGHKVEEVFPFDANEEDNAIAAYSDFLDICRKNGDSISAKLLEDIIDEEQIHFNYFDNVADHIADLGPAYLAQKAGTPSATGLNTMGFVARQGGGA